MEPAAIQDPAVFFSTPQGITYVSVSFILMVLLIIANWKIFKKAGRPGWHSIIPFLNLYDIVSISGMSGWLFLLLFIPFVNFIFICVLNIKLAKAFGKGIGFGIGLILLGNLFTLILAFGSAKYVGDRKD
ncbi:hypothetical protein IJG20_01195 [Candidatus Saccharibacteria bacterium]|nr:hypothetical protein [Candidatus Saccharibacteria bacterium]